uniref:C2H2-type domain-containing protein n=1 Tax=Knipowitschia caucasica TaxID=637954 RepID=A0AAV2L3C4_KNICA
MPRRKQDAPKRAPAYSPEDGTEHSVDTEEAQAEVQAPDPQDDHSTKEEFDKQSEGPVKNQASINKAQSGNPSWGGYPSIHAAYQFPSALKLQHSSLDKNSPIKFLFNGSSTLPSIAKNQPLISPLSTQSSPFSNNFQAMEDLVKKVSEKVAKVEQRVKQLSPKLENNHSPCSSETGDSHKGGESPGEWRAVTPANSDKGSHSDRASPVTEPKRDTEAKSPMTSTLKSSTAIITGHAPPEQPFVNPLSALQSVMNIHLGKAAKPSLPNQDPLSLLSRLSQSMAEKAAVGTPPSYTRKYESLADNSICLPNDDQPMDLTKGKSGRNSFSCPTPSTPSSTASSLSPSSHVTPAKLTVVSPYTSSSPLHENALSDISDMLRNLTQSSHVSKPPSRLRIPEKVELVGSTPDEDDPSLHSHKRKAQSLDECSTNGAVYRCQLCVRKFATKHAIKLHLSKSHGKSPEDHLLFVCELDKH